MRETARLLLNAPDEAIAGMICGMLENEGIPYYTNVPGAGAIYGSANLFGVQIYVLPADYERANALVEADFLSNAALLEEEWEGWKVNENGAEE
ncbi:DUF2007 domain-containing protein [Christensenellaceae bacterium OttesenSCG-928-L17]|nr:DUF2007 domain-containing protein [Christensenellaceae bacterium OttesenSCG-928-L17]